MIEQNTKEWAGIKQDIRNLKQYQLPSMYVMKGIDNDRTI